VTAVVGVKVQAFNWRLWQARRAAGLTQADLGLLIGSHAQRIGVIETLKSRPTAEEQDEIASALNVDASVLFPPEVLDLYGPMAATVRFVVPASRLRELRDAGQDADPARLVSGFADQIHDVVGTLPPGEQWTVRQRFGLGGEEPKTLKATGDQVGINQERIRQIEAKAMRKLRHPLRSKLLLPYLDNGNGRVPQGRAPTSAERKARTAKDKR
jgi:transcriptional regulator with XRE-family HTH domain